MRELFPLIMVPSLLELLLVGMYWQGLISPSLSIVSYHAFPLALAPWLALTLDLNSSPRHCP